MELLTTIGAMCGIVAILGWIVKGIWFTPGGEVPACTLNGIKVLPVNTHMLNNEMKLRDGMIVELAHRLGCSIDELSGNVVGIDKLSKLGIRIDRLECGAQKPRGHPHQDVHKTPVGVMKGSEWRDASAKEYVPSKYSGPDIIPGRRTVVTCVDCGETIADEWEPEEEAVDKVEPHAFPCLLQDGDRIAVQPFVAGESVKLLVWKKGRVLASEAIRLHPGDEMTVHVVTVTSEEGAG